MKSLIKFVVNGLALVGAAEIYKEYNSRKTSDPIVGSLDHDPKRRFTARTR